MQGTKSEVVIVLASFFCRTLADPSVTVASWAEESAMCQPVGGM